jgi:hypothetical protein
MSNRDIQRRLADQHFEDLRRAISAHSDAWLVEALRDIPHRKRMEVEKDTFVMIGILAHRAAKRIEELTAIASPETPVTLSPSEERSFSKVFEQSPRRLEETRSAGEAKESGQ